jgi:hypothetical protein
MVLVMGEHRSNNASAESHTDHRPGRHTGILRRTDTHDRLTSTIGDAGITMGARLTTQFRRRSRGWDR